MTNVEAPVRELDDASLFSFSFRVPGIAFLLAVGLVLRLALALLPGFGVDIGTFQAWSNQLANDGPWNFYREDFFTDYAPGYMYVLWLFGELNQVFHFSNEQFEYLLKMPAIIADLASAYLLYLMLKEDRPGAALASAALYLLFPAALLIGSVWGQVDSILAFFLLLTVYLIGRERPVAGAVAFTVGFLVKPQAIAALPFLAFWIIREQVALLRTDEGRDEALRTLGACVAVPLAVLVLLILPFFKWQPWNLIEQLYDATNVANYRVNSFWAFNFWNTGGLFDMGFRCDLASACPEDARARATEWLGIPTRYWGLGMFVAAIGGTIFALRRAQGMGFLALGTALSVMAFYMFLTRMHERYIFAFFLVFLLACVLINSRVLWGAFVVAGLVHFLNLYHVYAYYYPNELRWESLYKWLEKASFLGTGYETVQVLSAVFVVCFFIILGAAAGLGAKRSPPPPAEVT
jgi:Gpi18-like mannosyltransferase